MSQESGKGTPCRLKSLSDEEKGRGRTKKTYLCSLKWGREGIILPTVYNMIKNTGAKSTSAQHFKILVNTVSFS